MPKVSVIVPVYNAEKYLKRCIDSILNQTFTDFELILVDDGSTDLGGVFCDEYEKQDSRISVIHQKNAGVSAARNTGINKATGQYIMFCDSDDYVAASWISEMVEVITLNKKAFISCGVSRGCEFTEEDKESYVNKISYYDLYKMRASGYVCNKIYLLSVIKNNHISFDRNVPIAEGVLFNSNYLKYCNNEYLYIDKQLYFYEKNEESATHKYYVDGLKYHLNAFYCRVSYIEKEYLKAYCDEWLSVFIRMFDNIFDKRNHMFLFQKLKYNQTMMQSAEMKFCIENATGVNEDIRTMHLLQNGNYCLFWFFVKMVKIKNNIKKIGRNLK